MSAFEKSKRMTTEQVINNHNARMAELKQAEDDAQAERVRRNDEARKVYRAGLQTKRQAERDKMDAKTDALLEPDKIIARRSWLANHPDRNAADFEKTWKEHLRPNAVENLERQRGEATKAALLSSGRYSM